MFMSLSACCVELICCRVGCSRALTMASPSHMRCWGAGCLCICEVTLAKRQMPWGATGTIPFLFQPCISSSLWLPWGLQLPAVTYWVGRQSDVVILHYH